MTFVAPAITSNPAALDIDHLVSAASNGGLVLFLGAGVSAAPPSSGPMGSAVADRIRSTVAGWLAVEANTLEGLKLEALATHAYQASPANRGRMQTLLAESLGFREMSPNYAHRVAALLLREGAVQVVTTNWDQAVEAAAFEIGFRVEAMISIADDQAARTQTPLKKLHGCSSVPGSLRISQDEVDQAGLWSEAITSANLLSKSVAFVGYGTVAGYVEKPIQDALGSSPGYASALTVVSRSSPASWERILEGHSEARIVEADAEIFFDELLSRFLMPCLDRASLRAGVLAQHEPWGEGLVAGVESLVVALGQAPADRLLRWWRSPATSVPPGQQFAGTDAGVACLIAVGYLALCDGDIQFAGRGGTSRVETSKRFVEIASRPGQHFADARPAVEGFVRTRHLDGVYADDRPVTVVIDGVDGSIPAFSGEPDIAGDGRETFNIESSMMNAVSFVAAGDVLAGRIA